MKKIFWNYSSNLPVLFAILLLGCSKPSIPSFQRLETLKVERVAPVIYRISANAVYNNPNPFGGQLVRTDIDIFIDEQLIAKVEQDEAVEVAKNSEFIIPIVFRVDPVDLVNNRDGILQSIIEQIGQNEINIRYKGYVTVKMLSKKIKVPMDYTETTILNDLNVETN
ncbi:MAG: LEA type 2 family protein [Bacteroidia bacterium]